MSVKVVMTPKPYEDYTDAQLRNLISKRSVLVASGTLSEEGAVDFKNSIVKAQKILEARSSRFAN